MPPPPPPEEIAQLMRFIAEKTKDVKSPTSIRQLARQFKEESGSQMALRGVIARIEIHRQRIHAMDEFDMNTKVKMMFALSASVDNGFLNELKNQADVEVDGKGRITKYQSNDGNLKLEGSHGMSSILRSLYSNRWQEICQKANGGESEEEGDEDSNEQKDCESKRIDLIRFLIKRTENVTFPLNLRKLAIDYKEEFKCSKSPQSISHQISDFRQRIHEINQFDMPTKVKMMFALSAPINDNFLKELQKDAIVELDEQLRIKKFKANDGSLTLEGVHRGWPRRRTVTVNEKKVVDDSSESEEDDDEEDISETFGSDEEKDGYTADSVRSNQASTSSPKRRSQRIRKPKRARFSYSSSEAEEDDNDESGKGEDDIAMDSEIYNIDNGGDDIDQLSYHYYNERDIDMNNADNGGDDYNYDPLSYHYYDTEDMDYIPVETKPESLIEVKMEVPEELSNLKYDLIEPKIEEYNREVKKENEEGPSTTSSQNVSLLEFLHHFRRPAIKLNIPFVANKIEKEIDQLKEKDQQIPTNTVIESLETCIQILKTPDETNSDKVTISLSDFIDHLGLSMCYIAHPLMNELQKKLEKLVAGKEKKIPSEHIRYAMENALNKILH